MGKNKKKLIFFMPSMEGGGVEKNLIIVTNYVSRFIGDVSLMTFDDSFNKYFDKKVKIINVRKNEKKNIQSILNIFVVFGYLLKNISQIKIF